MSRFLNNLTIIGTVSFNNSLILGNDINGYSIYQYGTQSNVKSYFGGRVLIGATADDGNSSLQVNATASINKLYLPSTSQYSIYQTSTVSSNFFTGNVLMLQNASSTATIELSHTNSNANYGIQAYTNATFNKLFLNGDSTYLYATYNYTNGSGVDETIFKIRSTNRAYCRIQVTGTANAGDTCTFWVGTSMTQSIILGTYSWTQSTTYYGGSIDSSLLNSINNNFSNLSLANRFLATNVNNSYMVITTPLYFTNSNFNLYVTYSTTNTLFMGTYPTSGSLYYNAMGDGYDVNASIKMGITVFGQAYNKVLTPLLGSNGGVPYISFLNNTGIPSNTDFFITPNSIFNLSTITTLSNVLYIYGTNSTIGTTLKTSLFSATNTNSISLTTNDTNIGVTSSVNLNLLNISNSAFIPNSGTTSLSLLKLSPNIAQSNIAGSVSSPIAYGITRALYISPISLGNNETRGTSTFTVTNIGTIGSTVSFYGNNILLGTYSIASGIISSEINGIASSINSNSGTTGFQVLATSSSTFIITAPVGTGNLSLTYTSTYISSVGGPTFSLNGGGFYINGVNAGTASNWRTIQDDSWLGYSYYQSSSTAKNYFNGNLLLGSNLDNGNKLQISGTASWGVGSTSIKIDNSSMVFNYAGPTGGGVSTITTGYNYINQGTSYTSPFTIATFSVMPNLVTLFEITVISDSYNSGTGTSSHRYSITKLAASMVMPYNFSSPSSVQNIIGFATQSIYQFTYDPSNAAFSASSAAYLIANTASVTLYQPVAGSGYSFRFRYEIKTTIQGLAQ